MAGLGLFQINNCDLTIVYSYQELYTLKLFAVIGAMEYGRNYKDYMGVRNIGRYERVVIED